jgi:hypothetical protein
MMLFVQAHERFGRDGVGSPLAAASDGCLEPFLFDPKDDFRFSNAEGACKAGPSFLWSSGRPEMNFFAESCIHHKP